MTTKVRGGSKSTYNTQADATAATSLRVEDHLTTLGGVALGDDGAGEYIVVAPQALSEGDFLLAGGLVATLAGKRLKALIMGAGTKGNPQTNVGVQVHRDLTDVGTSSHGFNVSDYFVEDGLAVNPFGADIQVGDGTQTTEVLAHVNDFQVTDKINLGSATLSAHRSYTAQTLLESGTVPTVAGFSVTDLLGGRDTPGFSTPNFEVDGPAIVNNQTGVGTLIRHGVNARSIHCAAGNTDAGALLNSGGAPVDLECPVTIRQETEAVNPLSGALICTAGGIGAAGAIFGTNEMSVNGASPLFRFRTAANSPIGKLFHNGTDLLLYNDLSNNLKLGLGGASVLELKSDRLIPSVDATLNLGDTTHRWLQLFATTTTISTSDGETKTDPLPIDDKLLDAWEDVQHVMFKFKDAVEEKGDRARWHLGHIAQQIESALQSRGIDGFRYALLCKDELKEKVTLQRLVQKAKTVSEEIEVESFEKGAGGKLVRVLSKQWADKPILESCIVHNEDGSEYLVGGVPVVRTVPVMEEVTEYYEVEEPSGKFLMGLRYDQCAIVEAAYIRRELERVKAMNV